MKKIYGATTGQPTMTYEWSEEDDNILRQCWTQRKMTRKTIRDAISYTSGVTPSDAAVDKRAEELGLGLYTERDALIIEQDTELRERIINEYADYPRLSDLAKELHVTYPRLQKFAAMLGIERSENRPSPWESHRRKQIKKDKAREAIKDKLAVMGIEVTALDLVRGWPLPVGHTRTASIDPQETELVVLNHKTHRRKKWDPETYEVQELNGTYICSVTVNKRKEHKTTDRYGMPVTVWTAHDEEVYQRGIENRALSMIIDLPAMCYRVIDKEGDELFRRYPSDYYITDRERLQHRALIALWMFNHTNRERGVQRINAAYTEWVKLFGTTPALDNPYLEAIRHMRPKIDVKADSNDTEDTDNEPATEPTDNENE